MSLFTPFIDAIVNHWHRWIIVFTEKQIVNGTHKYHCTLPHPLTLVVKDNTVIVEQITGDRRLLSWLVSSTELLGDVIPFQFCIFDNTMTIHSPNYVMDELGTEWFRQSLMLLPVKDSIHFLKLHPDIRIQAGSRNHQVLKKYLDLNPKETFVLPLSLIGN